MMEILVGGNSMASKFNFVTQKEQSAIKTAIVTKYFSAWANIMKYKVEKMAYIDLYSGPGIYEDGTLSTPIIILQKIIADEILAKKTVTLFNEKDKEYYESLVKNISSIDNIDTLAYKPNVRNFEVNKSTADKFNFKLIPCFSFIDPAGYCGLTINLIQALGKDFGSDLIFFFNYNDINRGLKNPLVETHMRDLFGMDHYNQLISNLEDADDPESRELIILNELSLSIKDAGLSYILPFRFIFEGKDRTSHYLIFASKKYLGYNIMKEIMHGAGEKDNDGVGKYEFVPSCNKCGVQLSLIDMFNSSLDELKEHLLAKYKGIETTLSRIYPEDSIGNRYIERHYKQVLIELETEGKIICFPPKESRRPYRGMPTLKDDVKLIFKNKI